MEAYLIIRTVDLETTGMPPDAAVCEVGFCNILGDDDFGWNVHSPISMIVDPGRPMPPEAQAVHHISDQDCEGAPPATDAFRMLMDGADVFVAHNAAFEREFFAGGDRPWICTFKCARRAWPDLPSFGNQFLRYQLGLVLDHATAMPPHRAGPDAYVTAHILVDLLKEHSVKTLIDWTRMPVHYPRVPMTHAKGKRWDEIDAGLLSWFLKQDHVDSDIKAAARAEIKRRDGERSRGRF